MKKIKVIDTRKHSFIEQPCKLCNNISRVDDTSLSNLCDRCLMQKINRRKTMMMLVSEEGQCSSCGVSTHQLIRKMSDDGLVIIEKYLCESCHPVVEIVEENQIKSNKPAGWKFMREFVDVDGTVYHRGVEVPELKGQLEPTNVDAIKLLQKEKRKINKKKKEEKLKKKEEKLIKEFEKKKKLKENEEKKKFEEERKNIFFEDV